MAHNLEHFAIYADDSVAVKDFYVEMFGMKVARQNENTPPSYFLVDPRGMSIELIYRPQGQLGVNQRWVCHLAFWTDDFRRTVRELEARGIVFETDTAVEDENLKTAFFNDPGGNRCQIVWRSQPLAD